MPKKKRKPYTVSDARILRDLKQSSLTWNMQLEMARKYNQGDSTFMQLASEHLMSHQAIQAIVKRILKMDTKTLERIARIAEQNGLLE